MALENLVRVRLSDSQAAIYAAEAEARGVKISTYLRDRLEEADARREELGGIRAALIDLGDAVDEMREEWAGARPATTAQVDAGPAIPTAVQIETLLLLRSIANPQKLTMVRAELERQGITPWTVSEDRNAPGR